MLATNSANTIKPGDRVELFAVYPDRWLSRGEGIVHSIDDGGWGCVLREGAHAVYASTNPTLYGSVMVQEIPLNRSCQCLLPYRTFDK